MTPSRQKLAERRARRARVRAVVHPSFTGPLFDIWRRAREIWRQFCDRHQTTPRRLAIEGYVSRAEHRKMCDWLSHLEQLVRYLILTAAFAIKVTLGGAAKPRKRKGRRVFVWDDKPSTWVKLSLSIFPHRAKQHRYDRAKPKTLPRFVPSMPVARRLETLRRILVAPEACARRAAYHLARLAAANKGANSPRKLVVTEVTPRTRIVTRGWQATADDFATLMPLCEDRIDAWNRRPEPG